MSERMSSLAKTIRNQRTQIDILRTENAKLRAENHALAKNEEFRERVRQIEQASRELIPSMLNVRLTKAKRRLLGILYRTPDIVPRERLNVLMWGVDSGTDPRCLDVHMCKLRQRLKPHGITIETIHDIGYRLPSESRARVAALIEKQQRVAAAAVRLINGSQKGEQHAVEPRV